jgi:hypothetical protein
MADDTQSTNWDITVGLTSLTAVVFLASLLFVFGLSQGVQHNILGLCDISDYLRVAPSWALPTLGSYLCQTVMGWGRYGSAGNQQKQEPRSKILRLFSRWRNSDAAQFLTFLFLGLVSTITYLIYKQPWIAIITVFSWPLVYQNLAYTQLPGWSRLFQLPPQFAFFIPQIALVLGMSYHMGNCWIPLWEYSLSPRTITMKDHSQYSGKVVIELNRYLVIRNSEGKLIALQSSEILAMDLLERYHQAMPTPKPSVSTSPTPSVSPTPSPPRP